MYQILFRCIFCILVYIAGPVSSVYLQVCFSFIYYKYKLSYSLHARYIHRIYSFHYSIHLNVHLSVCVSL